MKQISTKKRPRGRNRKKKFYRFVRTAGNFCEIWGWLQTEVLGDNLDPVDSEPTNDMTERGIDGIYLRPNENDQGGHLVMNLNTGRRISRNKVTVCWMYYE